MSKIASIEKILSVVPHWNAERLDIVKILGYQCVTAKGLYKEGDLVVYIQPDSILPDEEWTADYRKYSPGRIKAVKLRGEFSEGIIVTFAQLPEGRLDTTVIEEGTDVAEALGIEHYEPPAPDDLSAKGRLPLGIPKTDENRFENMTSILPYGYPVDITLKIDGQSWSAYYDVDTKAFGILGRTLEFKTYCSNKYTDHINRYDIQNKLIEFCERNQVSLCIRGESYGEGIQSNANNPHSKEKAGLAIFSVYLIKERKYARPGDQYYFPEVCKELGLPTVPILERDVILTPELVEKYSTGIDKLDGKPFEGVVINHGPYQITRETKQIELPDGTLKEVGGIASYEAGSFKIINKSFDSKK